MFSNEMKVWVVMEAGISIPVAVYSTKEAADAKMLTNPNFFILFAPYNPEN
jgi:hypothetical protein